ncbi:glycine zipper 2TM domain-containing protein [Aurantiacibacter gangjinensis]|uniref:glycine zipper 2TM domain-containing protein n=1 Tax=Aurantiacibacter gangjinensis TaxID=502682 RepID=UPI00069AB2E8|nr:glycine zipper 2TM domain-containing protein [Aurantiacibacter gangjinensis]APE27525.1 hypothetical protein BMF35_a0696 [Aurantiacibacter gangjinensis]
MSKRFAGLLASAAIMATTPALAQHHHDAPPLEPLSGVHDGEWQGEWADDDTWRGMWNGTYTNRDGHTVQGQYVGTFIGNARFVTEDGHVLELGEDETWYEGADGVYIVRRGHHLGASPDGRLGYSMAEREAWLSDCRLLMADAGGYYGYDDRDADGGLIGGLLGAVAGGVIGNRVADGDRVLGTVIGGGLGALAGSAIGSAIDNDGDGEISGNELYAARYCDAYLRRYEMGGHSGFSDYGYGHGHHYGMMPAHGQRGHRHGRDCEVTVREEWVEIEAETPAPPARRAIAPRPRPEPGKTTPIN